MSVSTDYCPMPPVAARSKVWVCGRLLIGIGGSNPAGIVNVFLLLVLCVVR